MQSKGDLGKNIILIYILSYLTIPLGYLTRIIYSKTLSLEDFGLFYSIYGFLTLIAIFNNFGLSESLLYYGSKYFSQKKNNHLKSTTHLIFVTNLSITVLFTGILYFLSGWLSNNYFNNPESEKILIIFLAYYFFYNIINIVFISYSIKQKFFLTKIIEMMRVFLILLSATIPLFMINPSVYHFVIGVAIASGISFIISWALFLKEFSFLKKAKIEKSKKRFLEIIKYAYPSILSVGAMILLMRIDVQMITIFRNLTEVAYYTTASSTAKIMISLLAPINMIIIPITTELIFKKKKNKANSFLNILYKYQIIISVPILLIFVFFAKDILFVFFGKDYAVAYNSLRILALASFFSIFNSTNYQVLASLNKVKTKMKILYFGAIFNVIMDFLLIKQLGYVGVSIATTMTVTIIFFMTFHYIKNDFKIRPELNFVKLILITSILMFLAYILKKVISLNYILESGIILLIVVVTYTFLTWFFNLWSFKEITNMLSINKKLNKLIIIEDKLNVLLHKK